MYGSASYGSASYARPPTIGAPPARFLLIITNPLGPYDRDVAYQYNGAPPEIKKLIQVQIVPPGEGTTPIFIDRQNGKRFPAGAISANAVKILVENAKAAKEGGVAPPRRVDRGRAESSLRKPTPPSLKSTSTKGGDNSEDPFVSSGASESKHDGSDPFSASSRSETIHMSTDPFGSASDRSTMNCMSGTCDTSSVQISNMINNVRLKNEDRINYGSSSATNYSGERPTASFSVGSARGVRMPAGPPVHPPSAHPYSASMPSTSMPSASPSYYHPSIPAIRPEGMGAAMPSSSGFMSDSKAFDPGRYAGVRDGMSGMNPEIPSASMPSNYTSFISGSSGSSSSGGGAGGAGGTSTGDYSD